MDSDSFMPDKSDKGTSSVDSDKESTDNKLGFVFSDMESVKSERGETRGAMFAFNDRFHAIASF